jgi:hypothetical protein
MDAKSLRVVRQLQELLGPAVLLPIRHGEKKPTQTDWQLATLADMTPENLAVLDYRHNIGVLLGTASAGLCTIDVDADDYIEPFLSLNPNLETTLRTKSRRGCNFWVRVKGKFPALHGITHRTKTDSDGKPLKVGEWRADGGQTVIWGTHPSGCKYRRVVRSKPVELEFSEIHWPPDWARQEPDPACSDLEATHGPPYSIAKYGKVTFNTSFFAAKFKLEHRTLWHPGEQQFFQYDAAGGLWCPTTKDAIKFQFAADLKALLMKLN